VTALGDPFGVSVLALSAQAWSAIGSITVAVVAVLIALFQEPITRFHRRAGVSLAITQEEIRQMRFKNSAGEFVGFGLVVRLRIQHERGGMAENIEITVNDVWSLDDGLPVKHFYPMPISVSFVRPKRSWVFIPAGSSRYFDLGVLRRPFPDELDELPDTVDRVFFWFDPPFRPTPSSSDLYPQQLPAGRYEFELLLTGANVEPIRKRWRLDFGDQWSDDEAVMLQRITISQAGATRRAS
jgi:hypothetical protein